MGEAKACARGASSYFLCHLIPRFLFLLFLFSVFAFTFANFFSLCSCCFIYLFYFILIFRILSGFFTSSSSCWVSSPSIFHWKHHFSFTGFTVNTRCSFLRQLKIQSLRSYLRTAPLTLHCTPNSVSLWYPSSFSPSATRFRLKVNDFLVFYFYGGGPFLHIFQPPVFQPSLSFSLFSLFFCHLWFLVFMGVPSHAFVQSPHVCLDSVRCGGVLD